MGHYESQSSNFGPMKSFGGGGGGGGGGRSFGTMDAGGVWVDPGFPLFLIHLLFPGGYGGGSGNSGYGRGGRF